MGRGVPIGPGGVPDLGALKAQAAAGEGSGQRKVSQEEELAQLQQMLAASAPEMKPGVFVNDVQPTVETNGTVTLIFSYQSRIGASEPVIVHMPAGVFLALASNSRAIADAALELSAVHDSKVSAYLSGARAPMERSDHSGAPPPDLETARAMRDGGGQAG